MNDQGWNWTARKQLFKEQHHDWIDENDIGGNFSFWEMIHSTPFTKDVDARYIIQYTAAKHSTKEVWDVV